MKVINGLYFGRTQLQPMQKLSMFVEKWAIARNKNRNVFLAEEHSAVNTKKHHLK